MVRLLYGRLGVYDKIIESLNVESVIGNALGTVAEIDVKAHYPEIDVDRADYGRAGEIKGGADLYPDVEVDELAVEVEADAYRNATGCQEVEGRIVDQKVGISVKLSTQWACCQHGTDMHAYHTGFRSDREVCFASNRNGVAK